MGEIFSPFEIFTKTASEFADRPFLHIPASATRAYADNALDWTYGQAQNEINQLRTSFCEAGFRLGHKAALSLENRAEFFFHWLALNALGVSVIPVNPEFSLDEMAYVIGYSDADLIITLPEHAEKSLRVVERLNRLVPIVRTDEIDSLSSAPPSGKAGDLDTASECAILFTSGSTGPPKGCMLSNEYFVAMGDWYAALGGLCALERGKERLITPLPLVHMNAFACSTMGMIATGGCIIQLDRFHPLNWRETVNSSGASVVHYLGVMPAMLLTLEPDADDRNHNVKFGFGAGVNPKFHAAFEERFGFPLVEGWAMTETGSGGCIMANHEPRHVGTCCFGRPPAAVEVKVVDNSGAEIKDGAPGELLVRAAGDNPRKGFFSGYYKNQAATDEAWAGGWFHTGDIIRRGPDGFLHFVDRRKNIIRRSGENISALEVEAALASYPSVKNVAVSAVRDDIRGDEVMAAIILADHCRKDESTATELFENTQDALSYFKLPGYIAFVDALPLTASQKPKRGELRTFCETLIDEGKAFDLRAHKRRPRNNS